ncbi:MAG: FeoC-like transcriptional regulator [Rhodospirillales bacterium]|nr:FeoC-like transcriptional regulator [Rhodospirillales bacterium]MDH3792520.1 FeoC-like transcriptional regulator [Rhodospirillales bacterium]MDH3912966.1 FeoC-like transcriptional regulator [Rhodospirillales bacterium]MDH3917634.1 FeoC-like transcriptional regulator [Rhodospirillales bacterium]MDH3967467.1 FeoC-like transcriptional regulator [Rhodospirillales bacterium]
MILAQLKAHLAARGPVAVAGLAARFEVEPAAMRAMLEQLMRRGLVRPVPAAEACGGCTEVRCRWFGVLRLEKKGAQSTTYPEKLNVLSFWRHST